MTERLNEARRKRRGRMVLLVVLLTAPALMTVAAAAQTLLPLPSFDHTLSHESLSRGFWFTAPTSFVITGLQVPNETGSSIQNVEVLHMNGNRPPANYPGNSNYASIFRAVNQNADAIIPAQIRVAAGEVIGILGVAGNTTMHNSYAAADSFATRIAGYAVTIKRFGTQINLNQQSPVEVWTETIAPLARVQMYYTKCDNDGVVEAYEGCDDGNANDGDGCSAVCVVEPCWTCSGSPTTCAPLADGAPCDDNEFCNGADRCRAGVCLHAGDPCAAGAECNNLCNEGSNNCAVPSDTTCASDGMDCTADRCDGAGGCAHPLVSAGTLCRAALGVCDAPEHCDGASPACPADVFDNASICRIAAGVCDLTEVCDGSGPDCPSDSKSTGVCRSGRDSCDPMETCDGVSNDCPSDLGSQDSDADGVCDLLDPCTNVGGLKVENARVILRNLLTAPGDDKLRFVGKVTLPYPFSPSLDPASKGVRIVIEDALGSPVVDTTIPARASDAGARNGWKPNRLANSWTYRNASGWDGISKVVLKDKSSTTPGLIKFVVVGKDGSFPVGMLPLKATIVLDAPTAETGQCAEATFPGASSRPRCTSRAGGDKVVCR